MSIKTTAMFLCSAVRTLSFTALLCNFSLGSMERSFAHETRQSTNAVLASEETQELRVFCEMSTILQSTSELQVGETVAKCYLFFVTLNYNFKKCMLASQGKSVIWKTFLAKSLCFHGKPDKGKAGLA